ncbi:TonB family protein [Aquabacterium humicola]|uniref:TonB family protein n=1 Tax=Aquabacterium humicola TaxID=3237377 RepID=UPI002542CACC|nr:TonB family protein [Rubrivivax pictus]
MALRRGTRSLIPLLAVALLGGVQPCAGGDEPQGPASLLDLQPTGCRTLAYPAIAMAARAQGTTGVGFSIGPDGKVNKAVIVRPAGATREHRLLDRAAVEHLASCTFPVPAEPQRMVRIDYVWKHGLPDLPASAP